MTNDRDHQRSKVYAWEEHFVAPRDPSSIDATRLSICLNESNTSWYLLHELAHAMTSTHDGQSDRHGPVFMGLYAQLLVRYLRVPTDALLQSLTSAGIEAEMEAKPSFVDEFDAARL